MDRKFKITMLAGKGKGGTLGNVSLKVLTDSNGQLFSLKMWDMIFGFKFFSRSMKARRYFLRRHLLPFFRKSCSDFMEFLHKFWFFILHLYLDNQICAIKDGTAFLDKIKEFIRRCFNLEVIALATPGRSFGAGLEVGPGDIYIDNLSLGKPVAVSVLSRERGGLAWLEIRK